MKPGGPMAKDIETRANPTLNILGRIRPTLNASEVSLVHKLGHNYGLEGWSIVMLWLTGF